MKAKIHSKVFKRSIAGQIEYWAKIGQTVEENPDIPLPFIHNILVGSQQIRTGQGIPYVLQPCRLPRCPGNHYFSAEKFTIV